MHPISVAIVLLSKQNLSLRTHLKVTDAELREKELLCIEPKATALQNIAKQQKLRFVYRKSVTATPTYRISFNISAPVRKKYVITYSRFSGARRLF